jgi:acetyl-CoA carboxylase carboxyltransferase component
MNAPAPRAATPIMGQRSDSASAHVVDIDGRAVVVLRVEGGKHHGAVGEAGADAMERAVRTAVGLGLPFVAWLDTTGADIREGVSSLHGWGRAARALVDASGVVPTVAIVTGVCVSGPALCLGIVDHVIMTASAVAYVSGPDAVAELTGVALSHADLGGAAVHSRESGVASLLVEDERDAEHALAVLLSYLPSHHLADAPTWAAEDDPNRATDVAASVVPIAANQPYDVRDVIRDVMDADSFFELRGDHAPSIVVGLARLDGRSVGIVANQPLRRAGSIDIEASRKAARLVQVCDAFNLPIVTFVDTPGFEPGKDLEWRGMIRHGAQLVHAYAQATVPRLGVVLRKAYGGAYIVMDSKRLGNDWCVAWPGAEIAVMGAGGAVQVLHGRKLAAIADVSERARRERDLVDEYGARFTGPYAAAERGFVDAVIDPFDTRRVLALALERFATKREAAPHRRHSNIPL